MVGITRPALCIIHVGLKVLIQSCTCVCVCVSVCIHSIMYTCVCVCVCLLCGRERKKTEISIERESAELGGLWSASPQGRHRVSVRLDLTAPASPVPTHL